MKYIAHTREDGEMQSVLDHLEGTALLAQRYAIKDFKDLAYCIAKAHDLGKYSKAFQKRINGSNIRVEHSTCGAVEYRELLTDGEDVVFSSLIQYCIAGHHSGLPDGGTSVDAEGNTLMARINRIKNNSNSELDYKYYKNEIDLKIPDTKKQFEAIKSENTVEDRIELYAFFTKYMFSCLTDADFIDTEHFCNPQRKRGLRADLQHVLNKLDDYMFKFTQDTTLKKARSTLQKQAMENSKNSNEISLLNMPTGSGKTLCSLKIALERALETEKKRIIYVIPYTSIIEQTADTFKKILGDSIEIVQHHSNYNFDEDNLSDITTEKLKGACENWDASLIITTTIQFFQSMYHYKGSKLRKLHNMADSVIIFDEIHLLPINYLQPCLRGVGYITRFLNSEAIFLSATMPNYSEMFEKYLPKSTKGELITDKTCFDEFKTCGYVNLGDCTFEKVSIKALEYNSSLIIVNKRKSARKVFEMIDGKKFHLSTYITPNDRSRVINDIKECLAKNEKIIVVSTSLVEAGVDFDFEAVFREIAGIDSILQSGGRCNREGKRKNCNTYIFKTDEKLKGEIQLRANITSVMLKEYADISSNECIEDYYSRLFKFNERDIHENSIASFEGKSVSPESIAFRSYAESFEMIKSEMVSIIIDNDDVSHELVQALEYGEISVRRKLQRYTVSVYFYEFEDIYKTGILEKTNNTFVLKNTDYYDKDIGLNWDSSNDEKYIC